MTNWKRLYTDASLMLAKYQDEVVPRLRKEIEELKKNQVDVRCKDCKNNGECSIQDAMNWTPRTEIGDAFCSYGERREA